MQIKLGTFLALAGLLAVFVLNSQGGSAARLAAPPGGRAPVPAPAPGDWPMYGHDPQRTNYNPAETTISAGNVNQLVQRWQVNVGNNGTASSAAPSVTNGQVYVASSAASPANNFFVFDATSGSQAWAENIGYRSSCFNVGIGSTPAISGTTIVVGADNAQANPAYYGISTINGTRIWTNTMSVGASGFPWASALNYGNRTYVGIASRCDNPSVRGELRELDVNTGALIAHAYFVNSGGAGGGIWNSPALSPDGTQIYVGTGEDYSCTDCSLTRSMVSLDAATLAILQHHQEPSPNNDEDFGTTPVVFHDSQGRTLVAANHKNGTLYAYDVANINGGATWTRAINTSVGAMPAYDPTFGNGGTLYAEGGGAQLYALDPATGANRWPGASVTVSYGGNIAIANGLLFINTGNNLQIRNESDGSVVRTITPPNAGSANAGVAVSNGFIYWVSGSYVNAWSLPSGTPPPTATAGRPTSTPVPAPSHTPGAPTATPGGPSATPAPSATACAVTFGDVHPTDYFYTPVQYLACRGVISGYADGTFRPYNATTRGQMVKIVVLGFGKPITTPAGGAHTFADVPPAAPFFAVIETAAADNIISGYSCGGPGEPCDAQNRPYFRPNVSVTRGQLAKIVVVGAGWTLQNPASPTFADVMPNTAFYPFVETAACHGVISGYTCGGPGEPCDSQHRPYYRQFTDATRGQIAKIVYVALTGARLCAP